MLDEIAKVFQAMTAEYEATETLESKVAHDADKIETLLQTSEYRTQGYAAEAWQDTSIHALRTESAKQLAQAITTSNPRGWWMAFASSYHEL
ncbi:MAG TPA: HD domain-containing protein [Actinophytocola sp.]|uniref:HD domain-containing protein n=1 Tax=Actinophytocola sp. TaxID=1872138 RepID=UPI002DDD8582|nr:HD domain-containing protein [Actinophytocola sp.]HEV2780794.1 HD domain-containing protein [Actinophytocola sp.]